MVEKQEERVRTITILPRRETGLVPVQLRGLGRDDIVPRVREVLEAMTEQNPQA